MKIRYVRLSGSNPSMGPHNRPSSNTLDMIDREDVLADLLDNTTVNNAISLREYVALHRSNDTEALQRIHQAFEPELLRCGQRIITLTIGFSDGRDVALEDLRYFHIAGSGYQRFNTLIRKEGIVRQGPPDLGHGPIPF